MTHPVAAATRAAEEILVDRLGLTPLALPSELAAAHGTWKEQPASILTRAYSGSGMWYVRVVFMEGADLAIGNVLALPAPALSCPVLGADIVSLGARHGCMIAADLSSLGTEDSRTAEEAATGDALAAASDGGPSPTLTPGGTLPSWCSEFFSPHALYTRPTAAEFSAAVETFLDYPRAFARLVQSARLDDATMNQRVARWESYAAAHRTDDKGLQLLARVFGLRWAERFVHDVMFPSASVLT